MKTSRFLLAIAFAIMAFTIDVTLVGCAVFSAVDSAVKSIDRSLDSTLGGGKKYEPKVEVSDDFIKKEADHTWEVTDQTSWNAAALGINNAGNGKKHIVNVKNSFSTTNTFYTTTFYLTATDIAVVIEGNATISFSPSGRTIHLLDVGNRQAIIVRDIKLQGNGDNIGPLVNIQSGGKFIMEGSASVSGNTARGKSKIFGRACSITSSPGGVYVGGIFTMRDNASVFGNISSGSCQGSEFGRGGGVEVGVSGIFTMQDNASVTGNTAIEYGGGVYVNGRFVMQDKAKVSGNTANRDSDVYGIISQGESSAKTSKTITDGASNQENEELEPKKSEETPTEATEE